LSRKRTGNGDRKRTGEILFIDASEVGYMEDRTHRTFSDDDIAKIAGTYHEWRKPGGKYEDVKGFCKSADIEEITKHNFVLTPGRYVGLEDEEDDGIPFAEKMEEYLIDLSGQIAQEKKLDEEIKKQLNNIELNLK
jgi:type I restriction enzyme M protein